MIAAQLEPRPRFTWWMLLTMVGARFVLGLLSQALVAGIFLLRGDASPWETAAGWWTVYTSLVDLGCLALLVAFTRREGVRLRDLIGLEPKRLGRDLLSALGILVVVFPLAYAGMTLTSLAIYGTPQAPLDAAKLPLGWSLYSFTIWPALWGLVEQLTYNGYALPRLVKLTGRTWAAIAIVMLGWGVQHAALPFHWDWRWAVYRSIQYAPLVLLPILYLRSRRLIPFVIAHWLMDLSAALSVYFLAE